MIERKETIASIRIPLSEGSDLEADYKTNAFINLVCSFESGKKLPKRSDVRLNVSLGGGEIYKGPIKKKDLLDFCALIFLTSKSSDVKKALNKKNLKLKINDPKLIKFLKFKRKKIEKGGNKKI